jgi:hypothetical protein
MIEQIIQMLEQRAEISKKDCNPNHDYDRGYMAGYYSAIFDLKQLRNDVPVEEVAQDPLIFS